MSDYRCPVESEESRLAAQSVLARMRFCEPGIIEEFDVGTNLAKVKSAIKAKVTIDGKPEYKELPVVLRAPVVVQYAPTQCLCMTLPLKKGDPCLLLFSDRMIDNFVKDFQKGGKPVNPEMVGGANKTTEPRMHHLTDAICLPGLYGQPDKIKNWNPNAIEIRNCDRTAYFSLNKNGKLYIKAPGGVFIDSPTVNATNEIIGKDIRTHAGFDAETHLHCDVMPGPADTGTYTGCCGNSGIDGGGCGGSSCGDSSCDGSNCSGSGCTGGANCSGGPECDGGEGCDGYKGDGSCSDGSDCEDDGCEEHNKK